MDISEAGTMLRPQPRSLRVFKLFREDRAAVVAALSSPSDGLEERSSLSRFSRLSKRNSGRNVRSLKDKSRFASGGMSTRESFRGLKEETEMLPILL